MTPLDKPPPNTPGFFFPPIPQMPPMAAAPISSTAPHPDQNVSEITPNLASVYRDTDYSR